jgi:3-oxoacid CoA-transferase
MRSSSFLLFGLSSRRFASSVSGGRSKVFGSAQEALVQVKDGDMVLSGGFGLCGIAENLLAGLVAKGSRELTVVTNNGGVRDFGVGLLLRNGQVKRIIASFVGENKTIEELYLKGELELELIPQGSIAEKLRSGGAGIPAFYTATGVGTFLEHGGFPIKLKPDGSVVIPGKPRNTEMFNGKKYVREESLVADVALIKAWKGDTKGNLVFRGTAQNFNRPMGTAAKLVLAEVEEIVEPGELRAEDVHLQGIYVDGIIKGEKYEKRIANRKVRPANSTTTTTTSAPKKSRAEMNVREKIASRAALELKDQMYCNLGVGIPTLIPSYVSPSVDVTLQSENGLLGMGPYPLEGEEDADLINAGKETVTVIPGSSIFSSDQSFAMIRGGHVDVTILGAMQVSAAGDLANWVIPGSSVRGPGGAMDLVSSGSRVIITMEHTAKGAHKIVPTCTLPLTAPGCVSRIITEMAVFDVTPAGLELIELDDQVTMEELKKNTGVEFAVSSNLTSIRQ